MDEFAARAGLGLLMDKVVASAAAAVADVPDGASLLCRRLRRDPRARPRAC